MAWIVKNLYLILKSQVMKKSLFSLLLCLFFLLPTTAQRPDPFKGITNANVLPMLKHLPYRHGGMNVPARDGRQLHDLILEHGYKRGLEVGTSNGYSTLWLGLAFKETGGSLITIEIEPSRAREAQENFKYAELDETIDSRISDALKEIPLLKGEFDFVFIDAWKPDYIKYLEMILPKMKPGGAITAHNVTSQGGSMRDFLDAIQNNPNLETTIDRTGRAGMSISFVKK
jgi:caffeoyl-CoA O-methyltransferase